MFAVKLLRPEPVSEQGLADLNRSLAGGRDYERMEPLFEESLSAEQGPVMRRYLKRLRGDFLTAWAVCRLLEPIGLEADPRPGLFRCWLSFHGLFAVIWVKTYMDQSRQTAGQVNRLLAVFGGLRRRAHATGCRNGCRPEPGLTHMNLRIVLYFAE